MAKESKSIPENVDGSFFVDNSCINCGVSRHFAPEIFGNTGKYAYVKKQPGNEEELKTAIRALTACPMSSIGIRKNDNKLQIHADFPLAMTENIYINGFNSKNSYGAHSYFIRSANGNWMIDSPRYSTQLVRKFEEMGGIEYIFLSHRDDVCDAAKYARQFKSKRIIHTLESSAQKDAEIILEGDASCKISQAEIFFAPGHTAGHLVLLWDKRILFTGDHFAWIKRLNQFASFRKACWYSWEKQIESVKMMKDFKNVEWVFPGHGKWGQVFNGQFPEIIENAVQWMISVA